MQLSQTRQVQNTRNQIRPIAMTNQPMSIEHRRWNYAHDQAKRALKIYYQLWLHQSQSGNCPEPSMLLEDFVNHFDYVRTQNNPNGEIMISTLGLLDYLVITIPKNEPLLFSGLMGNKYRVSRPTQVHPYLRVEIL